MSNTGTGRKMDDIHEGRDGDRQWVIHLENQDRFIQTGKQIIEACNLKVGIEAWKGELISALEQVVRWSHLNSSRVRMCVVDVQPNGVRLYFVPQTAHFDFDLGDDLAVLNREISNSYAIGCVELHQLPEHGLRQFVTEDSSAKIFPSDVDPQRTVAA